MRKALTQPLSRKSTLIILVFLFAVVLLVVGGRSIFRKLTHQPPTAAEEKAVMWNYLEEKSGQDEFKKDFSALTNVESATVTRTNAAGRVSVRPRRRDAADPLRGLTREFRLEMAGANDYRTIYRLIGELLATAESLLSSAEPRRQEAGVLAALEALRAAQLDASDAWLGARICAAYLWPYVERAAHTNSGRLNVETLLNTADKAFRDAGETDNMIRNYRLVIGRTLKSNRADQARFRLARLLEDQQDFRGALECLKAIQNTNNPALSQRVALLEQRLQTRK